MRVAAGQLVAAIGVMLLCSAARVAAGEARIPVIYSSDLLHPYDDPDDHYDLATLFAIPEFDVKAIVLDLGERQAARSGRVPVEQMAAITGKRPPFAVGLAGKLKSTQDRAEDRPAAEQAGIELILRTLREAEGGVTIITAGSLRDVAAAFLREPELFRTKADRLYINIGSVDDVVEWNVSLDLEAFRVIMASGLNVYWCPCLPMKPHRNSTYWKFRQAEVLEQLEPPLLNFFVYALQRIPPGEIDPAAALRMDLRPYRHLPGTMDRNMWCTASFLHAGGYTVRVENNTFRVTRGPADGDAVFTFTPVAVELDERGRTARMTPDAGSSLQVFETADPVRYGAAMLASLKQLLPRVGKRVGASGE